MKTEQPVLPWHREAAKEINKALLRQNPTVSAIIARHDPHAATLRLLEEGARLVIRFGSSIEQEPIAESFAASVRAHLAAQKGTQ